MAPLMQPFASAPGAEAIAIAAAKTAANIHFMTCSPNIGNRRVNSISWRSFLSNARQKEQASVCLATTRLPPRWYAGSRDPALHEIRPVRSNSPPPTLANSSHHFGGPALLDHIAQCENDLRVSPRCCTVSHAAAQRY